MHKFLIYLSIYFCLTCFELSFRPSSEAGVQFRQWFKSRVWCQRPGLFFVYFCVLKCKMTLTMDYHIPFFTKSNFHTVLICTVHTVYKYKIAQYSHNV
jgi:hypothetical protein